MPTYTYECKKCGHVQDVFHAMSAKPRVTCEACKGRSMTRMLGTGAGLIFKGSGFYETDYKRGNGAKSDTAASSKDGAKADTKTETKSDSKTGSSSDSKGKSANASAA